MVRRNVGLGGTLRVSQAKKTVAAFIKKAGVGVAAKIPCWALAQERMEIWPLIEQYKLFDCAEKIILHVRIPLVLVW